MKAFFAAIIAFFTSLFSPAQTIPTPLPSPTPMATPIPTPSYSRQNYTNEVLNYQLSFPSDTSLQTSPSKQTSWDEKYTLRVDSLLQTPINMETILTTDLFCNADGPTGGVICQNTAVKPFTNQSGAPGFLVRRQKTITGLNETEYQDTAYVFPVNSSAAPAIVLSVETPTPENLIILTDIANWFTALP